MKKLIPGICMAILLLAGSCSERKYVSQREYIEYIQADTTKQKFSNAEKTGAVLFGVFVLYAIGENKD